MADINSLFSQLSKIGEAVARLEARHDSADKERSEMKVTITAIETGLTALRTSIAVDKATDSGKRIGFLAGLAALGGGSGAVGAAISRWFGN